MASSPRGLFIGLERGALATASRFRAAGGVIVGVVEASDALVARARETLGDAVPRYADVAAALAGNASGGTTSGGDVAFISSSNNRHAEHFIACAERGLHCWIEPPIALRHEDAVAMRAAAKKAGIKTAVPYATEDIFFLQEAVDLARKGRLGRIMQAFAIRVGGCGFASTGGDHPAVHQPEQSGGWIMYHMCHAVDWAMRVGGPVASVVCHADTTVADPQPHQEEAVTAMLRYRDTGTATLTENQLRYRHHRYAVLGDCGSIYIAHDPKARGEDVSVKIDLVVAEVAERREYTARQCQTIRDGQSTLHAFLDAIAGDKPSPVTLDRGVEIIRVCEALRQSAATGQPVTLG